MYICTHLCCRLGKQHKSYNAGLDQFTYITRIAYCFRTRLHISHKMMWCLVRVRYISPRRIYTAASTRYSKSVDWQWAQFAQLTNNANAVCSLARLSRQVLLSLTLCSISTELIDSLQFRDGQKLEWILAQSLRAYKGVVAAARFCREKISHLKCTLIYHSLANECMKKRSV